MPSKPLHELCQDCLNRENCDYIPESGKLLRCLDRRTPEIAEADNNPQQDVASEGSSVSTQMVD